MAQAAAAAPTEHLVHKGELKGHGGWVTAIATTGEQPDMIITASRDKSLIVWHLERGKDGLEKYGHAKKRLTGHSHFVQDVAISVDGMFALSGSWDSTLRLWDLNSGKPRAASSDTPKTCCRWPSALTTDKSSRDRATRRSTSGTLWVR